MRTRRNEDRLVNSSKYDLASFSCSWVMLSWIWSNSALTQGSSSLPFEWSRASVWSPSSGRPWSMSQRGLSGKNMINAPVAIVLALSRLIWENETYQVQQQEA